MPSFTEFLSTASNDDVVALDEARAYEHSARKLVTANRVSLTLVSHGFYQPIKQHTGSLVSITEPLMDRLTTNSQFNFFAGDADGQALLAMADQLITEGLLSESCKADLEAASTEVIQPFKRKTLYDVKVVRATCPMTPVNHIDGYVVVSTVTAVEQHNPGVFAVNPRTNRFELVGRIHGFVGDGIYDLYIPTRYQKLDLYIEDAYGLF